MLKNDYDILSLNEVKEAYYEKRDRISQKRGMLMTFDDGLSDHYLAAQILSDANISGVFFIPTCILIDKMPANPQIIHYVIAHYGIKTFLSYYNAVLEDLALHTDPSFHIKQRKDPFETISEIKKIFKYTLDFAIARKILLEIYTRAFSKDHSTMLDEIHLNEGKIREMISMGHAIGAHSHTHLSIAASKVTASDFSAEIIAPQQHLKKMFGIPADALSYPFGGKKDCLSSLELIKSTESYKLAFTAEPGLNTLNTDPFELARYMPSSADTAEKLKTTIERIR